MTYTIGQSEGTTVINILDNGRSYRTHTLRDEITDLEALVQALVNDAVIEKQREGEPE